MGASVNMSAFERAACEQGFTCVAGVDEVGRGPLAGPLVAAAVVLRNRPKGLRDSKVLTETQRASLFDKLQNGGHDIGLGIVEPAELDEIGLQRANYTAMLRAVNMLKCEPDCLLVDGFEIPGCAIHQVRVIKGDARSYTIAASSIVAKVTRDRLMVEMDCRYPGYGFATHKGYGVRQHLDAIKRLGPCPIHRRCFAPFRDQAVTGDLFAQTQEDCTS